MKKITLVFLLISMAYVTSAQMLMSAREHPGNVKSPGQFINNGNRSVPPGILIYSQPYSCPPIDGLSVQEGSFEVADDFIISSSSSINVVRWWYFWTQDPAGWVIRIYDNQSCLPSTLLGTWNIAPGDVTYEYVCDQYGYPIFDAWVNISPSFVPVPNAHYWISITPVNFEYWAEYGAAGYYLNCFGVVKCPGCGLPDFVDIATFLGHHYDFTFELYSGGTNPGEVPIANWAIGLGIFLILGLAAFRFRKIF